MTASTPTPLALEIRAEMARQQLTAADLAVRCDLSVSQVTRRLNGTVDISIGEAVILTDAVGVPLHTMLQRAQLTVAA